MSPNLSSAHFPPNRSAAEIRDSARDQNTGIRIHRSEYRAQNTYIRIQGSEYINQNTGLRIQASVQYRVQTKR